MPIKPALDGVHVKTTVYYADTDAGGVVYYANYLRWLEMARADWLAALGTPVASFVQQGVLFAVVRAEIDYLKPAVLGDEVEVTVEPRHARRVRFTLGQDVYRCSDHVKLVSAQITIACLTPDGRPTAVPPLLADELSRRM
jgi:acyl-CoA thioester hydrolase